MTLLAICGDYKATLDIGTQRQGPRITILKSLIDSSFGPNGDIKDDDKYLYVERKGDKIKIYFPHLIKEEIEEYFKKDEDDEERINYFRDKNIRYLDSQNRVNLSRVLNKEDLEKKVGKLKSDQTYRTILVGNGTHLFIDINDVTVEDKQK